MVFLRQKVKAFPLIREIREENYDGGGDLRDEMRAGRQSFHRLDDASISERANSKKSQEQRRIRRD